MQTSISALLGSKGMMRFGGICGVAGPILSIGLVIAATLVSPWFRWESNALSDLGVSEAAPMFNGGLILGGILFLLFTIALRAHLPDSKLTRAGTTILLRGGISLALVGVFTLDFPVPHTIVAVGYFILVPVGLILIGLASPDRGLRSFTVAMGVAALLAIFTLLGSGGELIGIAIPEIAEASIIGAWVVVMGFRLLAAR
jgi:hypothetical membrane protein